LIIIISILLGIIIIGITAFVTTSMYIKEKERQEFLAQREEYIIIYNKARIAYADMNLYLFLDIVTDGYNDVIDDTILYWGDYIDYQVYGYSKYKMKTFTAVTDKVYSENQSVFENNSKLKEGIYKWNMFIKDTKVNNPKTEEYKQSLLKLYNAYIELYNSIFAFNTSYNGFKSDTSTKINNYNSAYTDAKYYREKYSNQYLEEYTHFVITTGFDKYCDAWRYDEFGDEYTNFQNCYEEINSTLEIE